MIKFSSFSTFSSSSETTPTTMTTMTTPTTMITLIIILVMLAVVLSIALAVSLKGNSEADEVDRDYRDQDGNHYYYDESIIEKNRFRRLHPKEAARTFRRLFHRK